MLRKRFGKPEIAPDIAQLEAKQDVIGLLKAWDFKDKDLMLPAMNALQRIGKRAIDPLVQALGNDDERIQKHSAQMLGHLKDKRAIPHLVALLRVQGYDDADGFSLKWYAVRSLDELEWQPDKQESGLQYWIIKKGWEQCVPYGARAVPPLIEACGGQADQREAVVNVLSKIGKPAVEPLIAALNHQNQRIQKYTYWIYTSDEQLALNLKNKRIQEAAAKALGRIRDNRAVDPLIAALDHKDQDVQMAAAEALGLIGDLRAVAPLIRALNGKSYPLSVVSTAARALGFLKAPEAVDPLIVLLKHEEKGLRLEAAVALGKIGDSRAVDPLIDACGDQWANVRWVAAEALGKLKDRKAHAVLTDMTNNMNENESMRRVAFTALKEIYQDAPQEIDALAEKPRRTQQAQAENLEWAGLLQGKQSGKQVDAILILLRNPRNDAKRLVEQIQAQQVQLGHRIGPDCSAVWLVAGNSIGDGAYAYGALLAQFPQFGPGVSERAVQYPFQAPDGETGEYYVVYG